MRWYEERKGNIAVNVYNCGIARKHVNHVIAVWAVGWNFHTKKVTQSSSRIVVIQSDSTKIISLFAKNIHRHIHIYIMFILGPIIRVCSNYSIYTIKVSFIDLQSIYSIIPSSDFLRLGLWRKPHIIDR
mgnify:CR=1 FL=1